MNRYDKRTALVLAATNTPAEDDTEGDAGCDEEDDKDEDAKDIAARDSSAHTPGCVSPPHRRSRRASRHRRPTAVPCCRHEISALPLGVNSFGDYLRLYIKCIT